MLQPLVVPVVTDYSGMAIEVLEAVGFLIFAYAWVIYRRFPAQGRWMGNTEWTIFGKGVKFEGNTVAITDWTSRELLEHIRGLGVTFPTALEKLLASTSPQERVYLYGIRSGGATDRFDRDFGKILVISTENVEDPKFHDNLVARRILWTTSKKRIMLSQESIEIQEDFVEGWSVFAGVPRSVDPDAEYEPSEVTRAFGSIKWEDVAAILGVLRAAAHKASREGFFKAMYESAIKKLHAVEEEARKLADELDIARRALEKRPLEGGEPTKPTIPTKGNMILYLLVGAFVALGGGYAYFDYNLPSGLTPDVQLVIQKAVGNMLAGAIIAVMVAAIVIKWRVKE